MARKLPTPKDHNYLGLIKNTRYQVGTKCEMHKSPLERGMPSRASVRWYLKQCGDDPDLAAWMCMVDHELILSENKEYCAEILKLAQEFYGRYGKLSTVYNKVIAVECQVAYDYIYTKYELARQERVRLYKEWVDVLDPEQKLYKYGWKQKKKRKAISRSPTRRLLNRLAEKFLDYYGAVEDNPNFYSSNWGVMLKLQEYIYRNLKRGYDSKIAWDYIHETEEA